MYVLIFTKFIYEYLKVFIYKFINNWKERSLEANEF